MIETRREIKEDDWVPIRDILTERYSKKETNRRIAYFRKLHELADCHITIGLIGCNVVSFCVQTKKTTEKFVTKDWEL